MRVLMPMDDIISQLVHLLSSGNVAGSSYTLSDFANYGEHELAWKPFNNPDSCLLEDVRALMPKDAIIAQQLCMLSSEDSGLQESAACMIGEFAQYGKHELAWQAIQQF